LANLVSQDMLNSGSLYPPMADIRKISFEIAKAVAENAYECHLAKGERPNDIKAHIDSMIFEPNY